MERNESRGGPPQSMERGGSRPTTHAESGISGDAYQRGRQTKSLGDTSIADSTATDTKGVAAKIWQTYGGRHWQRYRSHLTLGLWLKFKDPQVESEYVESIKPTYRFRNPITGIYLAIVIIVIWTTFSSLMMREILAINDYIWKIIFDVCNAVSLCLIILLGCSNSIPCMKKHPEASCYLCTFPFYLLWILWLIAVLIDGDIRREELQNSVLSVFSAIQFKFWSDTAILVILFLLFAIYDQLMNTRTYLVFHMHVLSLLLYVASRIFTMYTFTDLGTREIVPTIVLTGVVQSMVVLGLITQAYIGRMHKELAERIAFIDVRDDRIRLRELREAQKKRKKGKAETVVEDLIHSVKKTQTTLQAAAFERSAHGDAGLLELDELLRQCVEILLDTDDLFAVGAPQEGVEGSEENKFINMFQLGKRTTGAAGDKGGAGARRTAEDCLRPSFDQQEFFTADIMPTFTVDPEVWEKAGKDPNLQLLQIYERNPNILVHFGQALLFPMIDLIKVDKTVITKYLYQIQRRYHRNPYHNACHGAMVAHMSSVITRMLQIDTKVRDLDRFALVIGALGHDVGHPGRNNNFYLNQSGLLARMYNDVSILESYHCFLAFRYAQIGAEVNVFQKLSVADYRSVRSSIIDFILITDMSQHFASISKFKVRRSSDKFDINRNLEDAQLVLRLCMKLADLSHGFVEWMQHLNWSLRVTEEFYQQGAEEASLKMPISPLCDSKTHGDFPKSQAGFLQFVVIPLALELQEVDFTGEYSQVLMSKVLFNKHKWEMYKEKGDTVPISDDVKAMKTAPPFWCEAVLIQGMRSKTVDEINTDPMGIQEVKAVMENVVARTEAAAVPAGAAEEEEEEEEEGSEDEEEEDSDEEEEDEDEEEDSDEEEEEEEEDSEEEEGDTASKPGPLDLSGGGGGSWEADPTTGLVSPRGGGDLISPQALQKAKPR